MAKMYYYNQKFPYDLNEFEIKDCLYLTGKTIEKSLQYVVTDYNVELGVKEIFDKWISVYAPYEDEEIYVHDLQFNNRLIMSFNKKKIKDWFEEDRREQLKALNKKIKLLEGDAE